LDCPAIATPSKTYFPAAQFTVRSLLQSGRFGPSAGAKTRLKRAQSQKDPRNVGGMKVTGERKSPPIAVKFYSRTSMRFEGYLAGILASSTRVVVPFLWSLAGKFNLYIFFMNSL
jgi:hypothetical protein